MNNLIIRLPKNKFDINNKNINSTDNWIKYINLFNLKDLGDKIVHDGPPFANGNIHFGHAFNKILKDIYVRFFYSQGFNVNYKLGWDCHGLPIERALKNKNSSYDKMPNNIENYLYKEFAQNYINIQNNSFKNLNLLISDPDYYTTMSFGYEAQVIQAFYTFLNNDLIFMQKRPILFDLSELFVSPYSEITYKEYESNSIYVKYFIKSLDAYVLIWTTTPWTLPGNQCILFSSNIDYVISKDKNENKFIHSLKFYEEFCKKLELNLISTIKIEEIENKQYFDEINNSYKNLLQDNNFVENEGTGFVHIAPGHGESDFEIGKKFNLEIKNSIDEKGIFYFLDKQIKVNNTKIPNTLVINFLKEKNMLFLSKKYIHNYPFSTRTHFPLIFISMQQVFMNVKKIKQIILDNIDNTKWIPELSKQRFEKTLQFREDLWCLSRTRSWGIPIPILYKDDVIIKDIQQQQTIIKFIKDNGSNFWFNSVKRNVIIDKIDNNCTISNFIFDTWFESGCSHLLFTKDVDLVIEGSDQHRGWFQSSSLISTALKLCDIRKSSIPFKNIITHGYIVNTLGNKLSKSSQNKQQDVDTFLKRVNPDILRIKINTSSFIGNDCLFDTNNIKNLEIVFNKIKRTFEYLSSFVSHINNLDYLNITCKYSKFIIDKSLEISSEIMELMNDYKNVDAFQVLFNFITNDISKYIDANKDNLYCNTNNSQEFIDCITTIAGILNILLPHISYISPSIFCNTCNLININDIASKKIDKNFKLNIQDKENINLLFEVKKYIDIDIDVLKKSSKCNSSSEIGLYIQDKEICNVIQQENYKNIFKKILGISQIINDYEEQLDLNYLSENKIGKIYLLSNNNKFIKCIRCWSYKYYKNINENMCLNCINANKELMEK